MKIIVTLCFLSIAFLILPLRLQAREAETFDGKENYYYNRYPTPISAAEKLKKNTEKNYKNVFDIVFKRKSSPTQSPQNTPSASPDEQEENSGSINPNKPVGKYIMYRQGDYDYEKSQNTNFVLPDGNKENKCFWIEEKINEKTGKKEEIVHYYSSVGDVEFAGCGPSAVTNIVANLKDPNVTPLDVLKQYGTRYGASSYADCRGTTIAGAQRALTYYGLKTEVISLVDPNTKQIYSMDVAINKIIPFLKNGAWIFAGGDFKYGGHYFVITDIIVENGEYSIIGLDSAYGNRNSAPINYKSSNVEMTLKSAMAVY